MHLGFKFYCSRIERSVCTNQSICGGVGLILTFGLTYRVSYLGPALAVMIIEMLVLFLTVYILRSFLKPLLGLNNEKSIFIN